MAFRKRGYDLNVQVLTEKSGQANKEKIEQNILEIVKQDRKVDYHRILFVLK